MDPARFPDAPHGLRFGDGVRQGSWMERRRTSIALAQGPWLTIRQSLPKRADEVIQ
jgi:hypothetical protein